MNNQRFPRKCPFYEVSRFQQRLLLIKYCCLFSLFCLTLVAPLSAQENTSSQDYTESAILLVEAKQDDARGFEDLREALEAHLGSNEIEVRLHEINKLASRPSDQVVCIRDIAQKLNISAVMWFDIPRQTLSLLFTDQDGNERILSRQFSCIKRNMRDCGDAIGSKVTSALSSWIGWKFSPSAPAAASAPPVEDNELDPIAIGDISWKEPKPLVRILLDGGYGFSFFRGTQGFTHGTRLGVDTVWLDHLKFQISTDIVFPIERDSEILGKSVEINRWPIRILAGGALPTRRWTFELTLGMAIDLMSFRKVSSHPFFDGVDFINYGFSADFTVRYFIEDWFAAWLSVELDIYKSGFDSSKQGQSSLANKMRGDPSLQCDKVLNSVALGISFSWSIHGNSIE